MTVASTTNKQSYNGNGSQSVFAYTFKIFVDADIKVYVGTTLKTLNTHYALSGVGDTSGGNVTFTSGNIPDTGTGNVTILRSLALTQGVDLVNYGRFDAEVVEAQYDKLTMMVQQLQEQADRTIRFSTTVSDAGGVEITDTVAERSGKVLAYDASGDLSVADELGEWKNNWATSIVYVVRDLVLDAATNNVYICLVAHTAGTLSTDVSASKWALVINAEAVATSATTATTKASEASASASTASTQATNSANSATASASSASTASTQAGIATTKASEAATSASTATTKASTATTQASTATTKASESSSSATSSASSAASSASSATTATTKASEASTSAGTATTKASEAAASATAASSSETASANSETASASSASGASTSASTATTKANESSASATSAANSAASAASAFDAFDDKYLGAKATEPTVDNDGDALVTGNLYFLTGTGMQVYDGANWIAASSSGNVSLYAYEYIATAGQTTFSGADTNGQTLSYTAGNLHVTYGGLDIPRADYTATTGTTVVLDDGALVDTIVRIVAFQSFVVADTYTQSQADVLLAAKSPLASPSFTGTVTADGLLSSGNVLVGKTTTSLGDEGVELRPDGIRTTRTDAIPLYANRLGSDGAVFEVRKDTVAVGSIGTYGNYATIGAVNTGLRFTDAVDAIQPHSMSTNLPTSGVTDLGRSNSQFKDLYLSGGVYLGGTGAANKLDDYESGDWTPTLGSSIPLTTAVGQYTKIGNRCFFSAEITIGTTSNTGAAYVSLPFAATNILANQGGASIAWTDYGSATYAYLLANNNRFYFRSVTGAGLTYANISGKTFRISGNFESQ